MALPRVRDDYVLLGADHLQAKKALWRGQSHGTAWTGGLVDADLSNGAG